MIRQSYTQNRFAQFYANSMSTAAFLLEEPLNS
jgi:hypothetical protein